MKKCQLLHFKYLSIIIVITFIVISGGFIIRNVSTSLEENRIENFLLTISKSILKQAKLSAGSAENIALSLPLGIEEICFVDRGSDTDRFVNNELNSYLSIFKEDNLFLKKGNRYIGYKIEDFKVARNPLCILPINNKVKLEFSSLGGKSKVSAVISELKIDCTTELYYGDSSNKVDIVFLPFGYRDLEDFKEDVGHYIQIFKEFELVKNNINKFNFYSIDEPKNLNCEIANYIKCDNNIIAESALKCPHDYIIVLVERGKVIDFISQVRSSTNGDIGKINTAEIDSVVIHEFGHAFGNLADEYSYKSFSGFDVDEVPNCDRQDCAKWNELEDAGCFKECTLGNFYRPTETSIMRNLNKRFFGPVNEKEILRRLSKYE